MVAIYSQFCFVHATALVLFALGRRSPFLMAICEGGTNGRPSLPQAERNIHDLLVIRTQAQGVARGRADPYDNRAS